MDPSRMIRKPSPRSLFSARFGQSGPVALMPLLLSALFLFACEQGPEAEATNEVAKEEAVSVASSEVTTLLTPRLLRLTGSLRGAQETDLAANVAGKVIKTEVERGQHVKQGDLLAQVDVKSAQLALAEARVSVATSETQQEISKSECERYEKLKKSGAVSELEYDQVTAKCRTAPLSVEAARARQSIAAKNVGDGIIRSPFTGVVTERHVEVGEYVQASSTVVSLAVVDHLRLIFSVPEKNFPDVKVGALVQLKVAAYGDTVFTGKVSHVSGAVRATRDIVVEAAVENPEQKLLPGMFCDVELTTGEDEVPSVPTTAVFSENGKQNVLVVEDGMLVQRVVQTGPAVGARTAVRAGLTLGEKVVTTYESSLKNGQKVK